MIEVRKLIPQVYNQSRDFSVFIGAIQVILNELDHKSKILSDIPQENVLLGKLKEFPAAKNDFRILLKNRGSLKTLLYLIKLSGGTLLSFDDETDYLEDNLVENPSARSSKLYVNGFLDREESILDEAGLDKNKLVYYEDYSKGIHQIFVNVKDSQNMDFKLFNSLKYYLCPVKTQVILKTVNA